MDPPVMSPRLSSMLAAFFADVVHFSHGAKLLPKQIDAQHSTPFMGKEHVKHAQLNHSLICTSPETIQYLRTEPLSSAVEFPKPDTSAKAEDSRNEEYWTTTYFSRSWNPEDVDEPLFQR